jgi:hypothetical protein
MLRCDATRQLLIAQILGSAHGDDMRDLLKNQNLNGLLGGTEQVILGDAAAKENDNRKMKVSCTWLQLGALLSLCDCNLDACAPTQTERCGKPVFDVVIVLDSNDRNAWTVIDDVAQAVDDVLAGRKYQVCIFKLLLIKLWLGLPYDFLTEEIGGWPCTAADTRVSLCVSDNVVCKDSRAMSD